MYKAVSNCGAAGDFTGETPRWGWSYTGKLLCDMSELATVLNHPSLFLTIFSTIFHYHISCRYIFSTNTCSGKHIISNVSSEIDISGRSKIKDVCWYFVEVSVYRIIIVIVIWHWNISYLDSFFVHKRTNDRIFWSLLEEYKAYLLLFLKFFLILCLKQKSF